VLVAASDSGAIPGYRYGDVSLPPATVSLADLARLKAALLFGEEDVAALRRAGEILVPRSDAILDVWYGFVGSHDFLLAYFTGPQGPSGDYLAAVRARFGQWIADTCRAEYDETWLAYQEEIGRRHYRAKNEADGPAAAGTPPLIHFRYVNALVYPIYATVRSFLEQGESDPAAVERMHQAWLKAVLLQATLWSRAYLPDGTW
jgi:hypothetical protein